MKNGEIIINGNTGNYLANKMNGGRIIVNGSTSDYAGCSLQGGEIIIKKNTGDYLGSSQQGNKIGMWSLGPALVIQIMGIMLDKLGWQTTFISSGVVGDIG